MDTIDLSVLNIVFTSKPIVVGGLAMKYYGLCEYVENAELHTESYMNAPDGTIYSGKY